MRILCATDLLPDSDAAIERAAWLAGQLKAQLTLLHVVMSEAPRTVSEETRGIALERLRFRARLPSCGRRHP